MRSGIAIGPLLLLAACAGDQSGDPRDDTTFVHSGSGAAQCEPESGTSLEQSRQTLVNAGIDVLDSSCGTLTGVAFPTVCGAPTGEILVHEIRTVNVPDAEELDYAPVETLVHPAEGTGYELTECRE